MLSTDIGKLTGSLSATIPLLIVTKQLSLVTPEVLGTTSSEIISASEAAAKINKTLDKLEETAEISTTKLDKKHSTVIRPRDIDEGAVHVSEAKIYQKYRAEKNLEHPSGSQYSMSFQEAENFSSKPIPKQLAPGTKLYRIIDKTDYSSVNGRYWSYDLPKNRSEWRNQYAVKKNWNKNGYYVEYVVPEDGLAAWEGTASSQELNEEGFLGWILEGGSSQVFIPRAKKDIPNTLTLLKTHWK